MSTIESMAAVVHMLTKKPRTKKEIGDLMGFKSRWSSHRYIEALKEEGLVEEDGEEQNIHNGKRFGPRAIRYRWVSAKQE